jgi:deazaflavin-dependent oxidoreductase (nitroreductase family)
MNIPRFAERIWRALVSLHIVVYRLLRGRFVGSNTILLTTTGRKSGAPRTTALLYIPDGETYVVVASYGGSDKHPAWYLNLSANPRVLVEDHGQRVETIATTVSDQDEYARLWSRLVAIYSPYESYKRRTTRMLPIVRLTPKRVYSPGN